MKNLIIIGSPRKKGFSSRIGSYFSDHLEENETIRVYDLNIEPCIHCDFCRNKPACPIADAMQEIYDKIREAENLLFVTPVYFFGLPGPLKNLVDRSQVFWNHPLPKNKRGAVVMVGEASNEKFKEFFYKTWFYILSNMGVEKFQFELMGKMTPEKKIPYSQLDEMIRFLKKENLT